MILAALFSVFLLSATVSHHPPVTGEGLILRGDWVSEGGRRFQYNPTYDFQYECQVRMLIFSENQIHFGSARLVFDNENLVFNGTDLQWHYGSMDRRRRVQTPLKIDQSLFAADSQTVYLQFYRGETAEKDSVILRAKYHTRVAGHAVESYPKSVYGRSQSQLDLIDRRNSWIESEFLQHPRLDITCFKRQ